MADLTFTSYLSPAMLPVYAAVAAAIGRELGLTTEVVTCASHRGYGQDGSDVNFVCGLPYVLSGTAGAEPAVPVAAPVLVGERYGGRPVYYGDVVVGVASHVRSFSDLAGGTWAYNERLSQSGYGTVRDHLVASGATHGFFGSVEEAGSHAAAMAMVADGRVDAAAIDSHVLELTARDDPALRAALRVVEPLGPWPIQPVTAARRLPAELHAALSEAFGHLHDDPAMGRVLAGGLIERFVPIGADAYEPIRAAVAAAAEAGFLEVR